MAFCDSFRSWIATFKPTVAPYFTISAENYVYVITLFQNFIFKILLSLLESTYKLTSKVTKLAI